MAKFRWLLLVLFASTIAPHLLWASGEDPPKIGLVLSGGGARGAAHVGVLKALEESGLRVDYIVGTSMGAIIGGLYAAGFTAAEIEQQLGETDWSKALSDAPARRDLNMRRKELDSEFLIPLAVGFNDGKIELPLGMIEGQHLDQILHRLLGSVRTVDDFDELAIPFRAVATDLVTGDEVVMSGGSLPSALRASMSVPGVFSPVRRDGRLLVDGGMANNLPVSVAREMGADIVIAVDISTPLLTEEELDSVVNVSLQLTGFLTRKNTERQIASLKDSDILLVPDLGKFSSGDFKDAATVIDAGYAAGRSMQPRFAALVNATGRNKPRGAPPGAEDYVVSFIELDNGSVLADEIILSRLDIPLGQPLDVDSLEQQLDTIYGLDLFQTVTYRLVTNEAGETGVSILAPARSWGPNYMQFNLEFSDDFAGDSNFKLGLAYTRHAMNSRGGELRVKGMIGQDHLLSIDFYQPVDREARWFIEPEVFYRKQNYNVFLDQELASILEIKGLGARFGGGRNFNTRSLLRLDYEFFRGDANFVAGSLPFPIDDKVEIGDLTLQFNYDALNEVNFATEGSRYAVGYMLARDELGAASDYSQLWASGTVAHSWGKHSAFGYFELGHSINDKAPVERWFRLGGLGRLSGLIPNELSGRNVGLLTLGYFRKVNDSDLFRTYVGFTLEAGNTWETEDDISFGSLYGAGSLFIGADTPIGPLYLAWGISEYGDGTLYFYFGNPFKIHRF